VPKISNRQVQAAVSAIVQTDQRAGPISPAHFNESNRVWIRRNLRKHLEPVLSEMGLGKAKLNEVIARHHDDVKRYLKRQEAEKKKTFSRLAKYYQIGVANRQDAIKRLAGSPLISAPLIIDKPASIFIYPSGMLAEDHIESGNSWAKLIWRDDDDVEGKEASVKFFFAWENPFDYLAVINVNAALAVRGQCTLSVSPGAVLGSSSDLFLTTQLKVHMSGIALGGHDQEQKITSFGVDTWGSIFGGDPVSETEDVFSTVNLSYKQILVDARQLVIIEVSMIAAYWIDTGSVDLIFARDHPYVSCPGVIIEILSAPRIVGDHPILSPDRSTD
jgi:hypothetical protein